MMSTSAMPTARASRISVPVQGSAVPRTISDQAANELRTPQRGTAWYGIRMTRDLNTAYVDPLAGVFPANRLGPTGDVPKINCATCHQGAYKPMYGASLLKTHPELAGVRTAAVAPSSGASAASAPAGQ